jgi:hypothetical protein
MTHIADLQEDFAKCLKRVLTLNGEMGPIFLFKKNEKSPLGDKYGGMGRILVGRNLRTWNIHS